MRNDRKSLQLKHYPISANECYERKLGIRDLPDAAQGNPPSKKDRGACVFVPVGQFFTLRTKAADRSVRPTRSLTSSTRR